MSFLERMRQKPRHTKTKYAFFSALSFTLVVGLIWGISLPARFSNTTTVAEGGQSWMNLQTFSHFIDSARLQVADIVDSVRPSPQEKSLEEQDTSLDQNDTATTAAEETLDLPDAESMVISASSSSSTIEAKVVLIATSSKATSTKKLKSADSSSGKSP